jgi:hypothetical protein
MSTLRVTTVTNPSGGQPTIDGLAKAWVNFNGTGTVAIRASLNVSSITDNGTGDYTVNFTNALADADYAAVVSGSNTAQTARSGTLNGDTAPSASSRRIAFCDYAGTLIDGSQINVAFFR